MLKIYATALVIITIMLLYIPALHVIYNYIYK